MKTHHITVKRAEATYCGHNFSIVADTEEAKAASMAHASDLMTHIINLNTESAGGWGWTIRYLVVNNNEQIKIVNNTPTLPNHKS